MGLETPESLAADFVRAGATIGLRADLHVRDVTEDIASTMRSTVAVLSGATQRSIGVTRTGEGAYEAGASTRYAPFIEHGTWKDPPQPFAGPAADKHEPELLLRLQLEALRI